MTTDWLQPTTDENLLADLQAVVSSRLGLRATHGPALRHRLLSLVRARGGEAYLRSLTLAPTTGPLWRELITLLTIHETYFYRIPEQFDALRLCVLPAMIQAKVRHPRPSLRLWCAGCSSGEEPYTLAMLVDQLLPDRRGWEITILGTDLDAGVLETARKGLYSDRSVVHLPAYLKRRYFRPISTGVWSLDKGIREMVRFQVHNLSGADQAPEPGRFDLIMCRNVLIYFAPQAFRRAVSLLIHSLKPGGWLVAGPAESAAELFAPLVPTLFPGALLFRAGPSQALASNALPGPWFPPAPASTDGPAKRREPAPKPDPEGEYHMALSLADAGEWDEALRVCQAALRLDPLHVGLLSLMATIREERGDTEAAAKEWQRVLYVSPNCPRALFHLGTLSIKRGKPRLGVELFRSLLRVLAFMDPDEAVPDAGGLSARQMTALVRTVIGNVSGWHPVTRLEEGRVSP